MGRYGKGTFLRPLRPVYLFTPELTQQVRRFIWARLLLYLGAMSSYFIGVMGTLTFAMGAGVGDNAIAVGLLNLCIVFGQIRGGGLLDRMGPHFYLRIAVAGLVASGLLYQWWVRASWASTSGPLCSGSHGAWPRPSRARTPPISRMTWMSSSASTRS